MRAFISGQAGVAVFLTEPAYFVTAAAPAQPVGCSWGDMGTLFAGADDVTELPETTHTDAVAALDQARSQDRALRLVLILLDPTSRFETRLAAANVADRLLATPGVESFVANRLYANPLPDGKADLSTALTAAAGADRVTEFLARLEAAQGRIVEIRHDWDEFAVTRFGDQAARRRAEDQLVRNGGFYQRVVDTTGRVAGGWTTVDDEAATATTPTQNPVKAPHLPADSPGPASNPSQLAPVDRGPATVTAPPGPPIIIPDLTRLPTTWGPYQLTRELGRGGMGIVYEAIPTAGPDTMPVALKVINPDESALRITAEMLTRFEREAGNGSRIAHPNVVRVLDHGTFPGGRPYLTMEYLRGGRLAERLGDYRAPARAARVALAATRALGALHAVGIIHRDVKPGNLLFRTSAAEPEEIVLTDFGLSRDLSDPHRVTAAGTFRGTPDYAAPEQLVSTAHAGPPADLYAIGVVFYRLLTGASPVVSFPGHLTTEYIEARQSALPPNLEDIFPTLPELFGSICRVCLTPDPDCRYQTAAELAADLEEAIRISQ